MLKKGERAGKKNIERIWRRGKQVASLNFSFRFLPSASLTPKISVIVPKSVSKLSSTRNLLRRRVYAVLLSLKKLDKLPKAEGAIMFKKNPGKFSKIEHEISEIFAKTN